MSKACKNCGLQTWGDFCGEDCELEWENRHKDLCQCEECRILRLETDYRGHLSSCAVHNEPAMPKGECNCDKLW